MLKHAVWLITLLVCRASLTQASVPECEAFNEHSLKPRWQCKPADSSWQALSPATNKFTPVQIEPIKPPDTDRVKNILVLSSKASSAYDESSFTLLQNLYNKSRHYRFTLFNYAQRCDQTSTGSICPEADAALHNAVAKHYDLVISMGSDTTIYLTKHAFNAIPVVSACAKDPRFLGLMGKSVKPGVSHIAYTSLDIDPKLQIDYLQSLFSNQLKNLVIVIDTDNISSVKTQAEPLETTIRTQYPELSTERISIQLQSHYKQLLKDNALQAFLQNTLYRAIDTYRTKYSQQNSHTDTLFLITGSTELFNHIGSINQHAGTIPVLSVTPSFIGPGSNSAFMALGVSFSRNARKAADYSYQILENGVAPGSLPLGKITSPDIAINFMHRPENFKVPFNFFENASYIYDANGKAVRCDGDNLLSPADNCLSLPQQ